MEVTLTDEQKAFVRQGIAMGRYSHEEDALREALSLWEERERCLAEIRADLAVAEDQFARGEGLTVSSKEESDQLADEINQRGMARLAAMAIKR